MCSKAQASTAERLICVPISYNNKNNNQAEKYKIKTMLPGKKSFHAIKLGKSKFT